MDFSETTCSDNLLLNLGGTKYCFSHFPSSSHQLWAIQSDSEEFRMVAVVLNSCFPAEHLQCALSYAKKTREERSGKVSMQASTTEKKLSCPRNNFLNKAQKYQFVHKLELKYYPETFVQPQLNQNQLIYLHPF